jgi:hypothetical protein
MKVRKLSFLIILIFIFRTAHSQQWTDVGGGADYQVRCFYNDTTNNKLYVGGGFDHLGGVLIHQVGIWDGTNWSPVGTNGHFIVSSSSSGSIEAITQFNGDLIVAGVFDSVAGILVNNIARWDGIQWNAMGAGFDDNVSALQVYNGELYAGGFFIHSGTDTTRYVAKWNGANWVPLYSGLNNSVLAMCIYKDTLVMGGGFYGTFLNEVESSSVIGWYNNNWISFNQGFDTYTYNVKIVMDTLYAVGDFSSSDIHHITKWDGQSWLSMPYPTGGSQPWITDITSFANNIYVCGYFQNPPDLALFNGSSYDSICSAVGYIKNLIVFNDELYVAGGFLSVNGIPFDNIARFHIVDATGDEIKVENEIRLFPNPLSKSQTAFIYFNDLSFDHQIKLFDLQGRLIQSLKSNNNPFNLKFTGVLEPGIYIITISDDNNESSLKLIIN